MHPDTYDLARFVDAQQTTYSVALQEIKAGHKVTHWMWFIFPQIDGLGSSSTSRYYAIKSIDEANAYLAHPVLGPRLIEATQAVLDVPNKTAEQIFGGVDAMKLHSSATLFGAASEKGSLFEQLLEKYFAGRRDEQTLQLAGLT